MIGLKAQLERREIVDSRIVVDLERAHLALNIFGSFCGPIAFGYLADRLGRRKSFMLFLILQAANVLVYTQGAVSAYRWPCSTPC